MAAPFCIKLPFLHSTLSDDKADFALNLCPGALDNYTDSYWKPANLPINQEQAEDFIRQMRIMDGKDLERMLLLHSSGNQADAADWLAEMADLQLFASNGVNAAQAKMKSRLMLEQAQKILLWIWLQEEALTELATLEADCLTKEDNILREVLEERKESGQVARLEHVLLPDWKICAANAAIFTPLETALFIEGPMFEELLEELPFQQMIREDFPINSEAALLYCKAPLWRVVGSAKPYDETRAPRDLLSLYNSERIWLGWSGR